jgi:hypothetical protein
VAVLGKDPAVVTAAALKAIQALRRHPNVVVEVVLTLLEQQQRQQHEPVRTKQSV